MKKSRISCFAILSMLFGIFLLQTGVGQEAPALEVSDSAVCLNVENRVCVDSKEEFAAGIEKLYCLTRINGAQEDTEVTHVWYYGNIERARIKLAVRTSSYRTFSSKQIQAHEIGQWRVDVLGPDDTVLKSIPFSIVQ